MTVARLLRHAVAVGLLVASANVAARTVPIELPPPITFSGWLDDALVSRVILAALAKRQWLVQSDDGHSITAEIRPRVHMARIRVDYNTREIRFAYLDSKALGYKHVDGAEYIHSSFNRWMHNLAVDIQIELRRQKFQRDPVHVVDPAGRSGAAAPRKAPRAGPPQRIESLPRDTVELVEPAPELTPEIAAPPPASTVVPAFNPGQRAYPVAGTPLRPRPSLGESGPALDPGRSLELRASVRNAEGLWWYVAGAEAEEPGWVPAAALRPGD